MKKRVGTVSTGKSNVWEMTVSSFKKLLENPILIVPYFLATFFLVIGVILSGLALVAFGIVGLDLSLLPFTGAQFALGLISSLILALLFTFVYLVINAGALGMVKDISQGKKTSLKAMMAYGKKFWLRYLGVSFLVGVILLAPVLIIIFPYFVLTPNVWYYYLFGGLMLLAVLLFALFFSLSLNYLLLEDRGVVNSIKRSFYVAKKNYLDLLLLVVLFAVISGIVGLIPYDPVAGILHFFINIARTIAFMIFAIEKK